MMQIHENIGADDSSKSIYLLNSHIHHQVNTAWDQQVEKISNNNSSFKAPFFNTLNSLCCTNNLTQKIYNLFFMEFHTVLQTHTLPVQALACYLVFMEFHTVLQTHTLPVQALACYLVFMEFHTVLQTHTLPVQALACYLVFMEFHTVLQTHTLPVQALACYLVFMEFHTVLQMHTLPVQALARYASL